MNICRLCLYKGDENQILSVWNCQVKDLSDKIRKCVSIDIQSDDELPTTICLSCMHKVEQWLKFKEICEKSNNVLLNNFIKKESNPETIQLTDNLTITAHDKHEVQNIPRDDKLLKSSDVISKSYDIKDELNHNEVYVNENIYRIKGKLNFTVGDYTCDICENRFDSIINYLDHQEEHDGSPVFKCDKCPEIFDSRKKIVEHDKNHRRACLQCGKMVLKSSMKLHVIQHTDRHICSHCSNRFNSKAALAQHIITVHTNIKNHICDVCGKRFSSKTSMRVHEKSHSDERLYKCQSCAYAGKTASALYVHMSTHANDLCVCEVCWKTFKSTRNLNDHLRRVHNNKKRHECNYCKKRFVDRYMLSVHIRCHTGIRPYKCKMCEKTFIRSDGLKEHMTIHGQRIPHICQKCNKKFTSKKGLIKHICKLYFLALFDSFYYTLLRFTHLVNHIGILKGI